MLTGCIGVFMSNVISSVVIATNQRIASEFDALSSAAWLLTTYTLAQSASQPLVWFAKCFSDSVET